jgi:hypothetical protein
LITSFTVASRGARMRGNVLAGLFTSVAAASFLLTGSLADNAEAAMLTPAAISGGGDAAFIQRVVNVCGANGCVRVQTQRVQHQRPGSVAAKHI